MRYCGPRSIPYEDFLDWGPLSRDAAMAWQAREDERCPGCGQLHSDWHEEDGAAKDQDDFPAFPKAITCPSCALVQQTEEGADTWPGRRVVWEPVDFSVPLDEEDASESNDDDG